MWLMNKTHFPLITLLLFKKKDLESELAELTVIFCHYNQFNW